LLTVFKRTGYESSIKTCPPYQNLAYAKVSGGPVFVESSYSFEIKRFNPIFLKSRKHTEYEGKV